MGAVGQILLHTAEHLQEQARLHPLVAADGRGEGSGQQLEGVLPLRDLLDVGHVLVHQDRLHQVPDGLDAGGHQLGWEHPVGKLLHGRREGAIHTDDLHPVAGLRLVTKLAVADHLDAPGDLPRRGGVRGLLDGEVLGVLVHAERRVHLQVLALVVLLWEAGAVQDAAHQARGVPVVALLYVPVIRVLVHVHGVQQLGLRHQASGH
mmetsp:Transcript_55524/g.132721  ORF Transcript_55524/g.132721 Transcript_55524/m.132721 type:complete len:206 (-) Transcript_55524:462-1079(-)